MGEPAIPLIHENSWEISSRIKPLRFYRNLVNASESISSHSGSDLYIDLNGTKIHIIFTDKKMESGLKVALQHIRSERVEDSDLTIYCIKVGDSGEREVFIPLMEGFGDTGRDIPFLNKDGVLISLWRESGSLSILNRNEGKALFLINDPENLAYYEKASPFRIIFQWLLDRNNSSMLHSGAVGIDGDGFLLSGRGGAGKSATALTCAMNGMDYLGDDYVGVVEEDDFKVVSIYNSAKLTEFSLALYPDLKKEVKNPCFSNEEKGVVFLGAGTGTDISRKVNLRGIIVPEITESENSSFSRISPAEGFRALAPSSIFQHTGNRDRITRFIGRLIKKIPCYKLYLGGDPRGVAQAVRRIYEE